MSVDLSQLRGQILTQNLKLALLLRRAEITKTLLDQEGRKVLSGPFLGMEILEQASWSDGDVAPKVLGVYEEELHGVVQAAVERKPAVVINVGCAEGYYAVGLARLLPEAQVIAHDVDPNAQAVCRKAAEANGVAGRMRFGGACTPDGLRASIAKSGRTLVFSDCEGGELQLLDPARTPELRGCDVIVECHDFVNRTITATLKQRFAPSHRIEDVIEGPRDPNRFQCLRKMDSTDRWLAVNEGRPEMINWLACWSQA